MWNCKPTMYPIILGVSEPAHTEEELAQFAQNSNAGITIDDVTMSRYEWSQQQRRLETRIRAQKDIAVAAKASGDMPARREAQRNINALQEQYTRISKAAGLDERPDKMTVAGFRKVKTAEELKKPADRGIINNKQGIKAAGGLRSPIRLLNTDEIAAIRIAISEIEADDSKFVFDIEKGTQYLDDLDIVIVSGNVFPSHSSDSARDRMSVRAVLAHEYYGHRSFRFTKAAPGSWNDEFRASYTAALITPGLADEDRQLLMRDALDRASEAGINIEINSEIRRILYGY